MATTDRFRFVVLLGVMLTVVGCGNAGTPRYQPPQGTIDLGTGKPGETVTGGFEIHNAGDAVLTFQIEASCGCTKLSPNGGSVPPGEKARIEVGLALRDYANSEKDATITVKTNDVETPESRHIIHAACPAPVAVTPQLVTFGDVAIEQAKNVKATVTIDLRAKGKQIPAQDVTTRVVGRTVTVNRTDSADTIELQVKLSPNAELAAGYVNDTIEVAVKGDDSVVRVAIYGQIVEPLRIAPRTLFVAPENKGDQEFQVLVWSGLSSVSLGKIAQVVAPDGVTVTDLTDPAVGRRKLKVVVKAKSEWTENPAIALRFEGCSHAAKIQLTRDSK